VYIYVKFPPRDLNLGSWPSHPTSTYICEVTTAPRVRGGAKSLLKLHSHVIFLLLNNKVKIWLSPKLKEQYLFHILLQTHLNIHDKGQGPYN